jgi:hypothetical protein
MTMAYGLRSRMTRKYHVRFCNGGGAGDRPADRNQSDAAAAAGTAAKIGYVTRLDLRPISVNSRRG